MIRWVQATAFCAMVGVYFCLTLLPSAQPVATAAASAANIPAVLFSESFDDPRLLQRGWYDGDRFAISRTQPYAGAGCIEYAWKARTTTPASSSGARHLFTANDTVYLRFYIRLSRGWGWTGVPYHPHLI